MSKMFDKVVHFNIAGNGSERRYLFAFVDQQFYQIVDMAAFGKIAVDVHAQRAPAMQDRRWEESFAALFHALLQRLLNTILILRSQGPHSLRQVTKTADGGFNFTYEFKLRQLVEALGQMLRQFQVALDSFGVAAL